MTELSTTEAKQMKPIIFSTPMVQAILAGRKTQTRRIIKPQPIDNREVDGNFFEGNHKGYVKIDGHPNWQKQFAYEFCPYGKVGDILYVRETWVRACLSEDGEGPAKGGNWRYWYKADDDWTKEDWHHPDIEGPVGSPRWKPSIHMPRSAARIFLKITGISVERLKSISKEDAISEGVQFTDFGKDQWGQQARGWHVFDVTGPDQCLGTAQSAFGNLWEKINGPESWEQNPWIWKITFEQTT